MIPIVTIIIMVSMKSMISILIHIMIIDGIVIMASPMVHACISQLCILCVAIGM